MEKERLCRGGIYFTRIKYVKEKYGTSGMSRLYERMKRYGYNGPASEEEIKIADWYPQKYDLIFLKAVKEEFGERALKNMGRTVPKINAGIPSTFLKWDPTPEELIKNSGKYWSMFYNFGKLEGKIIQRGEGIIRGYGISEDPIFCELLTNYFQGLVEWTGAKDVKVEHIKCAHRGDGVEEWIIRWKSEKIEKKREIKWDDSLASGVEEIDRQHKYFIKILNEINENINGGDKNSLISVLHFMDYYAHWHFSSEEKYMKMYNYPDFEKHHEQHEKFYRYTQDTIKKATEKVDDDLIFSVNKYLVDWVINHIMGEDKKFAHFMRTRNLVMQEEKMPAEIERKLNSF